MHRHKSTGWGLGERRKNPDSVLIFNFDVDSAQLKVEHQARLREWVVPHLKWGKSVTVVGLTSRTGSTMHNRHLSWVRCQRTMDFLKIEAPDDFAMRPAIGFGDLKAKAEGYGKHDENPRFRSVVILFGPKGTPPFPPALFDLTPSVPDSLTPEGSDVDIGKVNDVISGISGFLELVPWETVAIVAEYADLLTAVLGPVMTMPLLWRDVHEQNEKNGFLQGFWEGTQDMANLYSDPALSTKPLSKWPPLRRAQAKPLPWGSGDGLNQREWMEGKREGCDAAFEVVQTMERLPPIVKNWEITGRRYLFLLSQKFGNNVGAEIQRVIVSRLGGKWPQTG